MRYPYQQIGRVWYRMWRSPRSDWP